MREFDIDNRFTISNTGVSSCSDTVQRQLIRYVAGLEAFEVDDALAFWPTA